jgi:hypothetical protein
MSDLKQRILKISNEGSPIVIFSNTNGVSLQQMPDKKWSKLTEPHKNKIRKYVATRNEKLLESASSDDLMEIESHVLKYTGKKETRSTLDTQEQSESASQHIRGQSQHIRGQSQHIRGQSESASRQSRSQNRSHVEGTSEDEATVEAGGNVDPKIDEEDENPPQAEQKFDVLETQEENNEEENNEEDEYKKHNFEDGEPQSADVNSDLDLTPNFVNTFFGYIDSLLEKKKEPIEKVPVEDPSENEQKTQGSTTPDYSDPNAEVFSNASDSETKETVVDSLPDGWTEHVSTTSDPGKKYYFNEKTGETVWERPTNKSEEKAASPTVSDTSQTKDENENENKDENNDELAEGWTEHVSTSSDPGKKYYFNEKTGETVWEKPLKTSKKQTTEETEESEWTEHVSTSSDPGKKYYFNEKTGETVWEKPPGFDAAAPSSGESDESSKTKFNAKDKDVVAGQCFNCGSTNNLTLKTYKLEENRAVPVSFCCFKCFEAVEF